MLRTEPFDSVHLISMNGLPKRKDRFTENHIRFQAYGVKVGIEAEKQSHLKEIYSRLGRVFTGGLKPASESEIEYRFFVKRTRCGVYELYRNDEKTIEESDKEIFFDSVESQIRVTIAEFAREKVFLHAGVIGWKGRAIIIPATSYSGKTTLVAELAKKGALYYSDEYAILDADGNVEPFPKWLSLRGIIDDYTQLECSVESLGGVSGTETIPVKMILIARYDKKKKSPQKWRPKLLSGGQGMMEILPHTLPIRNKPEFVLKVLNKLVSRAIIVKTVRGEAKEFAETLLNFFEHNTDCNNP